MPDKELDIVVKLRDAASRGLKSIDRNVTGLGETAGKASKGLKSMYVQLVAIAGVLVGGALLGKAVKDFAAFDDNMRAAGAVTKATKDELLLMTEAAKDMGRETRYTSSQAAEALRFLGMAGLSAAQAVAALPNVLNLAAAGALDLGTAADITTNVLAAFGLEVDQLSRVNDVLVQTFTNSNVNLIEIGEAFKMVGPIAKGVGADFEDLIGTIGALGNAGIKGTLAGTALKNAFDALLIPTAKEKELMKELAQRIGVTSLKIKDANGDFIGFTKIIKQLEAANLSGTEALRLFGMRAGPGMAALLNMGSESLEELIEKLRDAGGVSQEIADQMEAGIGGEIRRTISLFESFKLTLGESIGPTAIKIMQNFRVELNKLIESVKVLQEDGTFDDWGENVIWVLNKVGNAMKTAVLRTSAFVQIMKAAGKAITGDFEGADEAMKGFVRDINKLFADEKDPLAEEAGKVIGEITQAMYDELAASALDKGPIGKGAKKVSDSLADKIISYPSIEAKLKSALIKLNADLKTESERIKGEYNQGLLDLSDYYDQRAEIVKRKIEAELAILRQAISQEEDVSKRAILGAQIYAKEEQLNTEILKLENDRVKAQEKLDLDRLRAEEKVNRLKLKAEKVLSDQRERIKEEGVTTLDAQFAKELSDLQTKQNSELSVTKAYNEAQLQLLRDRKASEKEIEAQSAINKAAIVEQSDLASEEKAQLMADQNLRLQEYRLNNLKSIASGTAQIFTQLYELTGKKNKEFFYIAKAAAIAEATMNVSQGVTKAIAQGGIWGIAQGAIVAAAGAAQIATIASQGLAEGGEVGGYSPHPKADNIKANLTAGEYVHPVDSVRHYGKGFMEAIRNKTFPRSAFAYGGYVKRDGRNFANGGMVEGGDAVQNGAGKPEINIINVNDPSQIDAYLSTAAGQDAVLNVIRARPQTAQRMLSGV